MFQQQIQTENSFVLNSATGKLEHLNNIQLRRLDNNYDPNYTSWLVEGQYQIQPSNYNDFATTKYDGYVIKRIPRNQFKDYIKNRFEDLLYEEIVDVNNNNDCLDNRFKYIQKLSLPKLVNKVWDNERFGFLNDGFFTTKSYVFIIEFNYSMFDSHFNQFN